MRTRLSLWTLPLAALAAACSETSALVAPPASSEDPPPVTAPTTVVILEFVAGDGQILTVGELAAEAFVVEARDSEGLPLTGVPVTMRATVEGGLFLPRETQSTDSEGRVSYNFQAPPTALLLGVQASAPGAETVFISVESHAGPATALDVQLDPSAISIGASATIEVVGQDRFGNVAELPPPEFSISGSAAVLNGGMIEGIELGEGTILASAGELRDSTSFVVFGQVWRQPLSKTPLKLKVRDNGDIVVLTIDALEVRDHLGILKLSVPTPDVPIDLAIDEARGRAFVSLWRPDDNIMVTDLFSGAVEIWPTGLIQAAKLTYESASDLLVTHDATRLVCIIPVTTQQCELREVGNLPLAAAVDPDVGVVLVSNHSRTAGNFDVTLLYLDGRTSTVTAVYNPLGVGIDTERHIGVVANSMGPSVTVVDLVSGQKIGDIDTGGRPMDMVLDSEAGLAVINHGFGDVVWLDLATLTVADRITYPHGHPGIAGSMQDRTVFLTPPYPDLLQLVALDEAITLPDLKPEGQVVMAAAASAGPYVAIVTSREPGLELHRLPVAATP